MKNKKSVAIFGGTFDPFHNGHLLLIKSALNIVGLDQVYLMPNYIPPHKAQPIATDQQRLEMVRLIAYTEPQISVLDYEIKKKEVSYTYETIKELYKAPEFFNSQISLIIGMDSLLSFNTWYHYQELLNIVNLITAKRPGYELSSLDHKLGGKLTKLSEFDKTLANQIVIFDNEEYDISSSVIRKSKFINHSEDVPLCIKEYILRNELYNL